MHLLGTSRQPVTVTAKVESWRTKPQAKVEVVYRNGRIEKLEVLLETRRNTGRVSFDAQGGLAGLARLPCGICCGARWLRRSGPQENWYPPRSTRRATTPSKSATATVENPWPSRPGKFSNSRHDPSASRSGPDDRMSYVAKPPKWHRKSPLRAYRWSVSHLPSLERFRNLLSPIRTIIFEIHFRYLPDPWPREIYMARQRLSWVPNFIEFQPHETRIVDTIARVLT